MPSAIRSYLNISEIQVILKQTRPQVRRFPNRSDSALNFSDSGLPAKNCLANQSYSTLFYSDTAHSLEQTFQSGSKSSVSCPGVGNDLLDGRWIVICWDSRTFNHQTLLYSLSLSRWFWKWISNTAWVLPLWNSLLWMVLNPLLIA